MSLYRKYRPQFFRDVVGQDAIVTTLKNGLLYGKVAHAYLFCGSRGTGKTTLARLLAKALNCSQLHDLEPCCSCPSCHDIALGISLDVMEIDGASNRGIDDIRKLNETVHYAPSSGHFKIYIIDEVHMLTKEAFNALLKTLEEPPQHVKFFFATTEPHKVLPTILSRCVRLDLHRISLEDMTKKLAFVASDMGVESELKALEIVALFAEGSLRDALSLLEQLLSYTQHLTVEKTEEVLGLVPSSCFFALDQATQNQDYTYPFTLAHHLFATGKDLGHFLSRLIHHFRAHLHLKHKLPSPFISNDERPRYLELSSVYTEEQCILILEYLIEWEQKMRTLHLHQTMMEMILLYVLRSKYRISLPALVQRLVLLEKKNSEPTTSQDISLELSKAPSSPSSPSPSQPMTQKDTKRCEEETPMSKQERSAPKDPNFKENDTKELNSGSSCPPQELRAIDTPPKNTASLARYDTLVRFAAVELEGVIKK